MTAKIYHPGLTEHSGVLAGPQDTPHAQTQCKHASCHTVSPQTALGAAAARPSWTVLVLSCE